MSLFYKLGPAFCREELMAKPSLLKVLQMSQEMDEVFWEEMSSPCDVLSYWQVEQATASDGTQQQWKTDI